MRLVIFDLDGTLIDSEQHIVLAQGRAFAAHGLPAPSRAASLAVVGLSLREAFVALVGEEGPIDSLADAYKAAWHEMAARPDYRETVYPGALETIAGLAARDDVALGVATGKSKRGVERVLSALGWQGVFATIQTADDHPSKPHPSMIIRALADVGAEPRDAVMIGDTGFDMAMAVAAGIEPLGVMWGFHEPQALRAAGATSLVASFDELIAALERGWGKASQR